MGNRQTINFLSQNSKSIETMQNKVGYKHQNRMKTHDSMIKRSYAVKNYFLGKCYLWKTFSSQNQRNQAEFEM